MDLKLYNQNGGLKAVVSASPSSTWSTELMGENVISTNFTIPEYLTLDVNDYIVVSGIRFSIKSEYKPQQNNTQEYVYNVRFYAPEHDAERVKMLNLTDGQFEPKFSLDGNPLEHLKKVVDNMNRIGRSIVWSMGDVTADGNKTIEYNNVSCWDALGSIAETFGTEWWADGYTINLTRCERGDIAELEYLKGLTTLTQSENSDNVKFFTRLIPLGSTRNIDKTKYGFQRLQLPGQVKFLEQNKQYGLYEHVEEEAFADIYPKRTGTISSVRSEEKKGENGPFTVYYFKDDGLDFDPNKYELQGLTKHASFQSGELNGQDFEVYFNSDKKEFEIVNTYPDDSRQLPGGHLIPENGDTYILWNIRMPDSYYTIAEKQYETAVLDFLSKGSIDAAIYRADTDYVYIEENKIPLITGQRVRLKSTLYFGETGQRDTRMTKVSRKLDTLSAATIECTDKVGKGWKKTMDAGMNELQYVVAEKFKQSVIEALKTWDMKDATNYNVFSSLRSRKEIDERALSKIRPDETEFLLKLLGGADVTHGLSTDTLTSTETLTQLLQVVDKLTAGSGAFKGTISSADYAQKLLGWLINEQGDIDAKSLRLRDFLEVPELRYNRVSVITGEQWNSPGGGIIESADETNRLLFLKLEPGELAAVEVDDICKGTFNNDTGFQTCYFRITEKVGEGTFKYILRSGYSFHPRKAMHFVCYGNFTNKERQTSAYTTTAYQRYLSGVNNWDITKEMIMMQFGDLSGLKLSGIDMTGYSAYLNRIYMTGTMKQISNDGLTESQVPCFKGEWTEGAYYFYDEVTHTGSTWLCISDEATTQEPAEGAADWLETSAKGKDAILIYLFSSNGNMFQNGAVSTLITAQVMKGGADITSSIPPNRFSWEKQSKNADTDKIFNETHAGHGYALEITPDDIYGRATFNCIVSL